MTCTDMDILLYIAKQGFRELKSSTLKIARELNVSQQTISRKLRDLESKGMVRRTSSPEGIIVSINEKGGEVLRKKYLELSKIFNPAKSNFMGIVQKGIGEGKHYVSLPQYQKNFKLKLGFSAYPGTLNLLTDKSDAKLLLSGSEPINIEGFETKSRTYGSIRCYKTKIRDIDAAIIIPERGRHPEELMEIIAPVNLREVLSLKDGDKVRVNLKCG